MQQCINDQLEEWKKEQKSPRRPLDDQLEEWKKEQKSPGRPLDEYGKI